MRYLLFTLALSVSLGCVSTKPSAGASAKKLYKVFYSNGANLYFIKPLEFTNGKDQLEADFTFKYVDNLDSLVAINYSLITEDAFKSDQPLSLSNQDGKTYTSSLPEVILKDREKSKFVIRYTVDIVLDELDQLMRQYDWTLQLESNQGTVKYLPTKKTKKKIITLNEELFVLFRD